MWTPPGLRKESDLSFFRLRRLHFPRTNKKPNRYECLEVLRARKNHGEDAPNDLHGRYLSNIAVSLR